VVFCIFDLKSSPNSGDTLREASKTAGDNASHTDALPANSSRTGLQKIRKKNEIYITFNQILSKYI
jgi:hypothetical protein